MLVELFAKVPTDDRAELMRTAITNANAIDSTTLPWKFSVRKELAVFLPVDHLEAPPSVIAHLEDTRTEKEIAFAIDRIINELTEAPHSAADPDEW